MEDAPFRMAAFLSQVELAMAGYLPLIEMQAEFHQLAKDICLHIASPAAPRFVSRDQVPDEELEYEKKIFETQARETGKPDVVIEKIVQGKLQAHLENVVLLDQKFVTPGLTHYQSVIESMLEGNLGIEKYFSYIVIKSPFVKTYYPMQKLFGEKA